jgi:hypothetical protein
MSARAQSALRAGFRVCCAGTAWFQSSPAAVLADTVTRALSKPCAEVLRYLPLITIEMPVKTALCFAGVAASRMGSMPGPLGPSIGMSVSAGVETSRWMRSIAYSRRPWLSTSSHAPPGVRAARRVSKPLLTDWSMPRVKMRTPCKHEKARLKNHGGRRESPDPCLPNCLMV